MTRYLLLLVLLTGAAVAQDKLIPAQPDKLTQHRFFDTHAKLALPAFLVFQGGDAWTTDRNYHSAWHTESNPLMPSTRAGQIGYFAGTAVTVIGAEYLLHKTGHHKLERMLEHVSVGTEAFATGHNLIVYGGTNGPK